MPIFQINIYDEKHKETVTGELTREVPDDGQMISTGLNVLLGERSTGKTYTLDQIHNIVHRVKYSE